MDPRTNPKPPASELPKRTTADPGEVAELIDLCKKGRVYQVERWLAAGKPLQFIDPELDPWRHPKTPLVVAIETGQVDLAFLLLCNGYMPNLEPHSILDLVLERREWDFLELLIAWGADASRADPDAVLDTYQSTLMERFWDAGVDFTRGNCIAYCLASSTSNKPAYGFAKRHREDPGVAYQLALALGDAVHEGREKAVCLLLWAGADPHRKVPSLRWGSGEEDDLDEDRESAIEVAVQMGHGNLLRHLKPDPTDEDFGELYRWVCDPDTVDFLFDLCPPDDWSKTIVRNVVRMSWWRSDRRASQRCLERIFEHHWGKLTALENHECQDFRRDLLKIESDSDLSWVLQKLAKPQHCDEAIFAELTRTPAIRKKIDNLGLTRLLPQKKPKRAAKRTPEKKQEVRQGKSPGYQEENWLRSLDPDTRAAVLRDLISREQLYKEIWAEPTTKVAERFGVSDVAVAKWCKKLNVPRPGRGYWARKEAGHRLKVLPLPKIIKGDRRYVSRPKLNGGESTAASAAIPGLEFFEKPIPVPEVVGREHPLVATTRRILEGADANEFGIVHMPGQEILNVRVSRASVGRALRIMNALIFSLEGAGFRVEVVATLDNAGQPSGYETSAVVRDQRIPFSITEMTRREERAPTDEERAEMRRKRWMRGPFFSHTPTGLLSIQIEGGLGGSRRRRRWSDGKNRRLEDCLYSFVRSLLISADVAKSAL